ncbi:MAG TPA: ATP-binding cassette domain-containing protein, partial [Euryarchaeota archaeon]|nr:ATP-binding cassette domain-containing protein [Euryarchaeota archaeon]
MGKKKKPMILVKSLTKKYNSSRKPVIDNLNMSVKKGEILILLGKSGCGKTTLLNIIAGLDRPTSGEVYIEGTRIDEMTEDQLARFRLLNVGFVFQDYNLINELTVLDNVTLPLKLAKNKNLDRAKKLLDIFDIAELADEKANTVSGGEAQRTA